ncbi:GTP 3',8-cyclase MoaA [Magnetospirillum sp. UT-4]|uniref:GTP 3',8-cyclase MoaA n=1 Tax=Magnetospirillum sp. UT-4 TaxID=2681467 RepID=UPI00137F6CA6|nr:GTP 3',8-cyclase MoaA [Magnetospirillum sp. UT-4]CAA7620513.1 Cyclic pyranopterin monophosphate synthase [Magnetospirillum sp. UT-4]
MLIDSFKRPIEYLRLSLTDRCDLRCVYCMSERMRFEPHDQILSLEEIERVCAAFIRLGVRKIRLTGGEPLVRRNALHLIGILGEWVRDGRLGELTLTTNGTRLAEFAGHLAAAGIRRINVSLDTLDPERFAALTRGGRLERVLEGLAAARAAGLRVRVNAVALRGVTDRDGPALVEWCHGQGFDLCFIEVMPLGEGRAVQDAASLPLAELRGLLERRWTLADSPYRSGGPARYVQVAETGGRIGFIAPEGHGFCHECNRVRMSCTGLLYPCLGREVAHDLRPVLRSGAGDSDLDRHLSDGIALKPAHHAFAAGCSAASPARAMSVTGG